MYAWILGGEMPLLFVNNPTAWVVVLGVVVLLFGGKNIPEMMKGLGQGVREFKKGLESEEPASSLSIAEQEAHTRREIEEENRTREPYNSSPLR